LIHGVILAHSRPATNRLPTLVGRCGKREA